jgi:hypothetical protein
VIRVSLKAVDIEDRLDHLWLDLLDDIRFRLRTLKLSGELWGAWLSISSTVLQAGSRGSP